MTLIEPLLFEPILKPRAWGGDRLRRFGKPVRSGDRIGESWEVADLPDSIPDGRSRIALGKFAGQTLGELLLSHRAEVMGLARPSADGRFPILVKFLDANEHLSVQVHPDAGYAAAVPGAHLKTEAWLVLEAQPGAVVFRGVRPDVDRDRFFAALESGATQEVVDSLVSVAVDRGDCIYLPSGICHALGAGILVAEVQTPSDTTFRLFDWNRNDPGRPLHLAEARRCMRFGTTQEDGCPGVVRRASAVAVETNGFITRSLCRTRFFEIESIEACRDSRLPVVTNNAPVVWVVTDGEIELAGPSGRALQLRAGDTVLMPASLAGWTARLANSATLLRTTVPTSLDTMIAR
ncbi:MAG: type I phosphomannose isomerase catalytic subunit [Phycisphaerales bacterium]